MRALTPAHTCSHLRTGRFDSPVCTHGSEAVGFLPGSTRLPFLLACARLACAHGARTTSNCARPCLHRWLLPSPLLPRNASLSPRQERRGILQVRPCRGVRAALPHEEAAHASWPVLQKAERKLPPFKGTPSLALGFLP